MIRIDWHGGRVDVNRLVLGKDVRGQLDATFRKLAAAHDIDVADDRAEPRRGDFWVWGEPTGGWSAFSASEIARARGGEVYLALARLHWTRPALPLEQVVTSVLEESAN